MYVNFIKNSIMTAMRPTSIGNQEGERVGLCKRLGAKISDDLKWNAHVEYVIPKAAKRLYALRLLKRAGVMPEDMFKVYTYNIRSVLEYAAQVYLSNAIEPIQRKALRIIFPNSRSSYQQALDQANLTSLADRRIFISKKSMADIRNERPYIFLSFASYDKIYPISVKIRKY